MKTVLTPSVLAAQEHYYGCRASIGSAPKRDPLTEDERAFIETRDSFNMATITESGWPSIQHRGGTARIPEDPESDAACVRRLQGKPPDAFHRQSRHQRPRRAIPHGLWTVRRIIKYSRRAASSCCLQRAWPLPNRCRKRLR